MLIGHETLLKDFKALADRRALAHGYVFFGEPRVGKGTFARALAAYLETGEFAAESPRPLSDTLLIQPSEGSIGIDPVRDMRTYLASLPQQSPYRTVIVDGAAALTDEAQNALLKITEEPPPGGLLILVIDDPERLRPTLLSRMRQIYFGPVPAKKIETWLTKEKKIPAAKAKAAAAEACGEPGLAWGLCSDEKLAERLSEAKKFLKTPAASRGAFIKSMLEEESFSLYEFLGSLLFVTAPAAGKNPAFWHAALELRRQASYFNLNPRLQLLALAQKLDDSSLAR